MLMPQTDSYGAETFAKQLNERLTGTPFIFGEKRYRVGASIGIALVPHHGANIHELMANADIAMYEAKRPDVPVPGFLHMNSNNYMF